MSIHPRSLALLFGLAACGGSVSSVPDRVPNYAATEATVDAGACIRVSQEGTTCVSGQRSCDRVDLCCASAFTCDNASKTWKLSGNACLLCQSHPCGNLTCQGNEMCVQHSGSGASSCVPYPTACAREWTCGCVEKSLPSSCTLVPNGCTDTTLPVTLRCTGS
ncbi:hypothetical protein BH09MYX1_BH09MYX1_49770 [soil metagenome]